MSDEEEYQPNEEYEDALDLQESQQDAQEEMMEVSANQKEQSNIYNLFWKVFNVRDSTKVANLQKTEMGEIGMTVRDAQRLGMLGHIFHHRTFGDFFFANAEIINATSMARNGWFTELFVSQKKFQTKAKKSSSSGNEGGWKMFQRKEANTAQKQ